LLDIAGLKGVEAMEAGQDTTMTDVRAALKRQGMEDFKFMPGDVVLFRTGWGKYWIKDNAKYNSGAPGIGMEVAKWLSDNVQAGVAGSDTWPVEVVPNPDKACAFCAHTHLITRHGILLQENMDLDGPARDKVYTFLYVFSPMPIAGATGSAGAPLAIK
ncbi:MAG: cyclase family protein, partial [Candidatus Entotheonellia bacterium]